MRVGLRLAGLGPILLAVGACSTSGGDTGSTLKNMLLYGGTTVPPVAEQQVVESVDCPTVTVSEGRAAIRSGGGDDGASVRTQISIANVARECIERPDGSVVVKVGVEGRVLLGPGGSGNRFDAPVTFSLTRNDQPFVTKTQRASVTIPPGRYEQNFVVVQGDLVVPPGTAEYDIVVGLGEDGAKAATARARRKRSG